MPKIKRTTAVARLRRDCTKKEEVLYISRSIAAENEFGECYIADWHNNAVIENGSLVDVMNGRNLLRKGEEVE